MPEGPPPRRAQGEVRAGGLLVLAAVVLSLAAAEPAAADPPQIGETWVTEVTATAANLRAEVDPEGMSTTYRFEYLTQAAYEANLAAAREGFAGAALAPPSGAAALGAGGTAIAVVQHAGSLSPGTAYRYRARATSAAGTEYGAERVFATSEPTASLSPIDGRGYELVSPAEKEGGAVGAPESVFGGGDFQAAADGDSFTFSSPSSFGEAAGAPPASQYLATRSGAGWTTRNLSRPLESGGYGDEPDGAPFRIFSEDLGRALLVDPRRCAAAEECRRGYSLLETATGASAPLPAEAAGMRVLAASPGLDRLLFAGEAGTFAWSGGALVPTVLLPPTAGPGAVFQLASADGRFVFYAEGGHLYRYDAVAEAATDLTPAGGVLGVLGGSSSGGAVYYQDGAGLERWSEGTTTEVVAGPEAAAAGDYPPATGTARVSADGEHLAFLSKAAIPPFDNHDADTDAPDAELYLYGPAPGGGAPRLVCASCNPTGERPQGSASIPGAVANGSTALYRPRVLSAGGNRVFFDSADRLVLADTDARPDVYEWEAGGVGGCTRQPGCLGLISGGRGEGGRFLDASADGDDVFFLTGDSLLGSDPGSIDVYDDRVGGGFAEPAAPFVCKGDACQALPSAPEDPSPATLVPTSGNPPLRIEKRKAKRRHASRHRARRHHKRGRR